MRLSILKFGLLISLAIGMHQKAEAGVLIEPLAGLEMGSFGADISSGGTLKYNYAGTHFGARVGYALPLIFVAVEYDYGMLNTSVDQPAGATYKAGSGTRSTAFAEAGVKIPFLLRAYVGYGFLNDWTFKDALTTDSLKFSGTAYKAGVAFTGLPFIEVGLDIQTSTFTKYNAGASDITMDSTQTFKSATASSFMLTVGLPFDF